MVLHSDTHAHLSAHHGDFAEFANAMVESSKNRFDDVFWGFFTAHVERSLGAHPTTLVDFGTGPGMLLAEMAQRYPQTQLVGVDAQPAMLAKADELVVPKSKNIRILAHDLGHPPISGIESGSADVVVASMVVHEMLVPSSLIDEAKRILRTGGVLLIYDWVRQPLSSYCKGERPDNLDKYQHFSEHCRYTPEDVAWLVEKSGFTVREWMARHNGRHVLLAAVKS